jgi:hypothetical protein
MFRCLHGADCLHTDLGCDTAQSCRRLRTFRRNMVPSSVTTLKMVATSPTETLVSADMTTRCHNPEDLNLKNSTCRSQDLHFMSRTAHFTTRCDNWVTTRFSQFQYQHTSICHRHWQILSSSKICQWFSNESYYICVTDYRYVSQSLV